MIGPKLSVIIPTHNRAGHLPTSVNSVLDGSRCDVEVLVLDDGSTDETDEVVRAFGPPARYIRREDAGPAAARDAGFAENRGLFAAFLDSDDFWMYDAPSRFVGLVLTELGRHHPDVVSPARRASNRLALRHLADAVTGACEFSLEGLCESDGFAADRARVIENGIDVDEYP